VQTRAPRLNGGTHINLTVRDLDVSTEWYCRALGFEPIRDATPTGSGFTFRTLVHAGSLASIVLGQPDDAEIPPFDENRVGLHHLAYHVPERTDLDLWAAHLDASDVANTGVKELFMEAGFGIWMRDPDNIWLELYWLNANFFMARLRDRWRAKRDGTAPDGDDSTPQQGDERAGRVLA
jgi:catechol-2,3-dioxygenase